jgi:TatD DNase family protein
VPNRGKRNEPSMLPFIAEKISQIKGISIEEVAQITSENASKIFNYSRSF